jgi:hypothetical protein
MEFQLEWELEKASWKETVPDKNVVRTMMERCKLFAALINSIVRDETNIWVKEFENALHQLDESARSKPTTTAHTVESQTTN